MHINGAWMLCDDGAVRPVIRGEVQNAAKDWVVIAFLVDTGADRTVFTASAFHALGFAAESQGEKLGGVGGAAHFVEVETALQLFAEDLGPITFRGRYAAFTEDNYLDMCVLGRDIMNLFALIVDRARDVVCLLGQEHRYTIECTPPT